MQPAAVGQRGFCPTALGAKALRPGSRCRRGPRCRHRGRSGRRPAGRSVLRSPAAGLRGTAAGVLPAAARILLSATASRVLLSAATAAVVGNSFLLKRPSIRGPFLASGRNRFALPRASRGGPAGRPGRCPLRSPSSAQRKTSPGLFTAKRGRYSVIFQRFRSLFQLLSTVSASVRSDSSPVLPAWSATGKAVSLFGLGASTVQAFLLGDSFRLIWSFVAHRLQPSIWSCGVGSLLRGHLPLYS